MPIMTQCDYVEMPLGYNLCINGVSSSVIARPIPRKAKIKIVCGRNAMIFMGIHPTIYKRLKKGTIVTADIYKFTGIAVPFNGAAILSSMYEVIG